ncbi:MAG: hypothetical protein WCV88_01065 [Patescibacteria group bacterium]|jgi:hypothetical protein
MVLLWWYSTGLVSLLRQVRDQITSFAQSLNLGTLTKYLFVPMYGYNDIWSRIISFCVRLVQFVITAIITLVYIVIELCGVVIWLLAPPVVIGNLIYQIIGLLWIQ